MFIDGDLSKKIFLPMSQLHRFTLFHSKENCKVKVYNRYSLPQKMAGFSWPGLYWTEKQSFLTFASDIPKTWVTVKLVSSMHCHQRSVLSLTLLWCFIHVEMQPETMQQHRGTHLFWDKSCVCACVHVLDKWR